MPIQTAKSHKSQKVDGQAKPRQRKIDGVIAIPSEGSSLVLSPSSEDDAATVSGLPTSQPPESGGSGTLDTGIPAEKPREEQPWYRKPDSKLRGQAEKIAVMRAAGRPVGDIAKRLKTTEANVRFIEYIARKNGWYDEDDQPVDIEAELALSIDRKVVRNISASLDGQMTNWQTHEMTVQAAKGRGIFKNHDKVDSTAQEMTVVAIRVEMSAIGAGDQQVLDEANIGGVPAYVEGEVTDELQPRYLGSPEEEANPAVVHDGADGLSGVSGLGQGLPQE